MNDSSLRAAAIEPLPAEARVVIVGGGVMGLAIAYHLAALGERSVIVIEKSYLCGGASGRNGGGVRAQWSTESHVELMRESIAHCAEFATRMGINVWFRQGGYLFVARTDERAEQLAQAVALHRSCGLSTKLIDLRQAKAIVPELDISPYVAATYNSTDGVVFPWPFMWGYAQEATRMGVALRTFTEVLAIEREAGRVALVRTNRGTIRTSLVINAAGAWSPDVARLCGVELPNRPYRHEICSTEPLKPFLHPLVAELESGLYVSQSMRGELVGGISDTTVEPGLDQRSTMRFVARYSRALLVAMPILSGVRVLRQWAGCYDVTPDKIPLLGPVDECPGLFLACGFVGYGFMMAPAIGRRVAEHIVGRSIEPRVNSWNLRRFQGGVTQGETMNLG